MNKSDSENPSYYEHQIKIGSDNLYSSKSHYFEII